MTTTNTEISIAEDLIFGAQAIAAVLGLTRRQVYHAEANAHLPAFKIGGTVCARRTTLLRWFAELEKSTH